MLDLIEKLSKVEILLSSSIVTVVITHLFYKYKLKSEQRVRYQNIIGDSITESLIELRDLVQEAAIIERYELIHHDQDIEGTPNVFEGTIYPEIMNDIDSLLNFTERLDKSRLKHEKYLDVKTALYLWYGSRYFSQLIYYVGNQGYQNQLPELGTMFIYDIQKWHFEFDKILIKRINKPLNKIELHQGKRWKMNRKHFMKSWEKSLLYKSINDFHEDVPEITAFFEYLEELKNNNQKRA